ncbi:putative ribosomal Rna (adenine(1779)-N(6)/adenine(1780)-N(6))- dimethyltransferase [Cardiosporidium cionae]|uniref:rRNA adenine N(6)-methyltransferase n=1 Tax=Cardiosporidium cionae TaxID=476202 RepID=A0ABQ7J3M5_9APIC|nr:putative ribosomal Rna (adenine(1779)-N(6)/adenine(1780)-N(6))- dimethyltransferase [Cardiosporidium cionae]|eukprot:KAF8817695.1 putative ribosomal Rna (adenine(1779)-N(6)/adenine(1780)-N(6))- dimethyltransferase [Cardiosporidium cionae]
MPKHRQVARGCGGGPMFLKKPLGQHLLRNPGIVDKMVQAAAIQPSDTVLEIGPGTGNLTIKLVAAARKVVAFDVDAQMIDEVKKRCLSMGYTNLETRQGDALRQDFGKFDVCAANLPYKISSRFLFKLLASAPFRCAVLMFQKEVALRLMAEPNQRNYGRLAINTRLFCKVTKVCDVSAANFNPPPRVDSMVVKITPRHPPLDVSSTFISVALPSVIQ